MKENNLQVSVIIPTYNRAHLVGRAIESVLNQTYQNFEIIVVDDGSTDNTEEVVKNFNNKVIRYIRHKENRGGGAARNTGIKEAEGNYIAFLDDDDEWLPEKLEKQISFFDDKSSELGVVYTGLIRVDETGEYIVKQYIRVPDIHVPEKRRWIYEDLLLKDYVGTISTVLVKKECFEKIGLFDESLPSCQDWDICIRIAKMYQFDFIESPLIKYYRHACRITTNLEAKIKGRVMLLNKFFSEITSKRRIYSEHRYGIGVLYCRAGNMKKGREELLRAIKLYPFKLIYFVHFGSALFTPNIYVRLARIKEKLHLLLPKKQKGRRHR